MSLENLKEAKPIPFVRSWFYAELVVDDTDTAYGT